MQGNGLLFEYSQPCYQERYTHFQFKWHEDGGTSVWEAFDNKRKDYVVIKRIPRGQSIDKHVERELVNRNTLIHPHIVRLKKIKPTDTTLDVVLEYVPERNVENYLNMCGPLTEERARFLFQQLCLAVDYCHKRCICVRNITLENLVLDEKCEILKIYNFNLCKDLQESVARSKVGSCDYMSPEMLSLELYDGYAADMWACGVCLYAMLYGYLPFANVEDTNANRFDNTCERILNQKLIIHDTQVDEYFREVKISDEVKRVMTGLLKHNPRRRTTMKEVLRDPWFLECLPPDSFKMNAAVDPIDDKLICAQFKKPEKKDVKQLLYTAAQPPEASSYYNNYPM